MSLPVTAHMSRPWRIHELTPDFELEDVWALPTPGGAEDFPRLVELVALFDPAKSRSRATRSLFAARWKIGGLFGWDRAESGVGARVATLRDRLPADLRAGSEGPTFAAVPFRSLYMTADEWAAESANATMHGVVHVSWVPDGAGGHRGQLAILVKRNGLLGSVYMAAIRPFRHLVVYPAVMREVARSWRARDGHEPLAE